MHRITIDKARLYLAMADACMSNAELEKKSGITNATLFKAWSGKQTPRPATIGKIAHALGVSVEYLCGLDEPK